jgi:hypothetical protein
MSNRSVEPRIEPPRYVIELRARRNDYGRKPIRGLRQGQRPQAPRSQAGHMTAPNPICPSALFPLAPQGPPTHDEYLNQGDLVKRVSLLPSDFKTGTRKLSFDRFAPPC